LLAGLGGRMNRVTLYRILDLLVERGVAARHNAGERSFRYCLGRGVHGHSHFHCNRCGQTQCLDSRLLEPGLSRILSGLPMRVEMAEVTLGGSARLPERLSRCSLNERSRLDDESRPGRVSAYVR
jgi:Fur family ferric uptake transcriptional regulator